MSFALYIPVKETMSQLKVELKKAKPMFVPRIKMLIEMKKAGDAGISKRSLMELVGTGSQSIHNWRTMYKNGGLDLLLSHNRRGFKPSVFTKEERQQLQDVLENPTNYINGYVELNEWVKTEFNKEIKYNTLLKYCVRNFKSKVKVARKSHIKKDKEAVEAFKKTSVVSANKQLKKPTKTSNQ